MVSVTFHNMTIKGSRFVILFLFFVNSVIVSGVTDSPNIDFGHQKKIANFDGRQRDLSDLVKAENGTLHRTNSEVGGVEFAESRIFSIPFDDKYFSFDKKDWTVYKLPEYGNEEMIISSMSADVNKEITITTVVDPSSDLLVKYQFHMTTNEHEKNPTFTVQLQSNGKRTLLKREQPTEEWNHASLRIKTNEKSELIFVGVLGWRGNQIAVRGLTVEDLSPLTPKRYGDVFHHETQFDSISRDGTKEDTTSDSEMSKLPNTQQNQTASGPIQTQSFGDPSFFAPDGDEAMAGLFDAAQEKGINPDFEEGNGFSETIHPIEKYPPIFRQIHKQYTSPTPPPTPPSDNNYNSSLATLYVTQPNDWEAASPSIATDVAIFFAIFGAAILLIVAAIWWRRRRKIPEDEIPVFSRGLSEHGNPTFTEDQTNYEVSMSATEGTTNYKSFE